MGLRPFLIYNVFEKQVSSKHCLIRKFSGPSEIFRCYLIVYCLIINVLLLSRDSLFRLSHRFCLVNNFFYFFQFFFQTAVALLSNEVDSIILFSTCQHLFWYFFNNFSMAFLSLLPWRVCDGDSLSTDPFCNKNTLHFKGVRVWLVHCSFPDPSPTPCHGSTPVISCSQTRTTQYQATDQPPLRSTPATSLFSKSSAHTLPSLT